MIRKPAGDWQPREHAAVAAVRTATPLVASIARVTTHWLRGIFLWSLALLWGIVAMVSLLYGQIPTAIGIGLLAAAVAWGGKRAFAGANVVPISDEPTLTVDVATDRASAVQSGNCAVMYPEARLRRSTAACAAVRARKTMTAPEALPIKRTRAVGGETLFDPDAIIANYLDEKEELERLGAAPMKDSSARSHGLPKRSTFGRKVT